MFTNQTHLRHILRPDQYHSEHQHRAELRHLFASAWHPLATTRDLAKPGDFLTFDLLETPVLIRNFDGELRAFLNVCPHRHSRLTDKAKGNTERLKCQYHGWEYNKDGKTGKIPDARAFRPWDRENACLRPFRLETCGEIVFINMSDEGVSLREWLGPLWAIWSASFGGDYRYTATWEHEFTCNWKVVLENSLESYHIPQIHPKTFKDYPEESNAWHELDPEYSTFRTIVPGGWVNWWMELFIRCIGVPVTKTYWHHVRHPHITYSSMDVHRLIMCVFPTSPTTCRYRSILYTLRGHRRNPLAWGLARTLRPIVVSVAKKLYWEDATIYGAVQRGLEASPYTGVIGTREERVYVFQEYVTRLCRGATELPQAQPQEAASPAGVSGTNGVSG
jgi:phenylpropionate dioxygenase-like ring-hydroxylating dioxygenase large terminal subunit